MWKTLEVTVGLLCLFTIASAAVPWTEMIRNNEEEEVCLTPECVIAAGEIIQSMDKTVNPCDDFFKFACGGWIQKHPMPESKSRWTQFDVLRDGLRDVLQEFLRESPNDADPIPVNSARDMYKGCMNTDILEQLGLKPLTDLLEQFGGWPMTQPNWRSDDFNLQDAVVGARKLFGLNYFLRMYVHLDKKDTERSNIYLDQGSLSLSRPILLKPAAHQKIVVSYKNYIAGAAKAVRDSLGNTRVTDEQVSKEVEALFAFESRLAKITATKDRRRNKSRLYNPFFLPELQEWTDTVSTSSDHSEINWFKYFSDIFEGVPDTTVDPEERIIVADPEYLKKLVALLDKTPLRTIANYVHWRLVRDLGGETNQLMVDLAFDFSKALYGSFKPEPRWRKCVNTVNNYLGFAVSAKYVEKTFDETTKLEAEEMIARVSNAFMELVEEAEWIDDDTKEVALEKGEAIRKLVAYPDLIKNRTALESFYEGVQIDATNHFGNIQNVRTFVGVLRLKTLRTRTDRTKWPTAPSVVNAFYAPEYNAITFPAAILQPPFFGRGRLKAMNYGAIGSIIGHEITHGFDDRGRQLDEDGNLGSWWTPDTLAQYRARAKCFVDQYNNYTIPELAGTETPRLRGLSTLSENIADNGGIREAYRAYTTYLSENGPEPLVPGLQQYTPDQIFFISYAINYCGHETLQRLQASIRTDPHSPSRFRVIGPLSNSEDFVRAFKCPAGSKMNRLNKCIIW